MPSKNLYEVLLGLRQFGVGTKVTRSIYRFPDTHWEVTRVTTKPLQTHSKIYGRLVWRGVPKDKEEEIRCPLKKQWKLVAFPDYKENAPKSAQQ